METTIDEFDAADLIVVPTSMWQKFRALPLWQQGLAAAAATVAIGSTLAGTVAADEGMSKSKIRSAMKRSDKRGQEKAIEPNLEQVRDFAAVGAMRNECAANSDADGCFSVRSAEKRLQRTEEWGLGDATRAEVMRAKEIRKKRMAIERTTTDTLGGVDREGRQHVIARAANETGDQGAGFATAHGRRIARSDKQIRDLAIGRAKRFAQARVALEEQGRMQPSHFKRFYKD